MCKREHLLNQATVSKCAAVDVCLGKNIFYDLSLRLSSLVFVYSSKRKQ